MLHNEEVGDRRYATQSSHEHRNTNVTQLKGEAVFDMGLISSYSSKPLYGYKIKATTLLETERFSQTSHSHLLGGQRIKA